MEKDTVIAIVALGLGTYLLRVIPLILRSMMLHKSGSVKANPQKGFWGAIGPMLISALLAVSLVPSQEKMSLPYAFSVVFALALTWLSFRRFRNLGISIVLGAGSYGIVSYLINS